MQLNFIVAGRTRRKDTSTVTWHSLLFFLLLTVVQQLSVASAQLSEPEKALLEQQPLVIGPSQNSSTILPTRTAITVEPTIVPTVESSTLVVPPPQPSPTAIDNGGIVGGNTGSNRNVGTPTAKVVPIVTNTVIVVPPKEGSKTTTAKLTVTDNGPDPTDEADPNDQPEISSTSSPATDSSFSSAINVTTLAIVVPVVVVLAIAGIWVVRKWKLSPSRRFEEKFQSRHRGPRTAESDTVFLRELNA